MKRLALLGILMASPPTVGAEIFKSATPGESGLELHWWPILPVVYGWQQDLAASQSHSANMLVPAGHTFKEAPAVIYARAVYKPRVPETRSLAKLITDDLEAFTQHVPGVLIKEEAQLRDGDGKAIKRFSFAPPGKGNWEVVAYSEEGDFYLLFTVSATNEVALRDATPAFERLVTTYKERL